MQLRKKATPRFRGAALFKRAELGGKMRARNGKRADHAFCCDRYRSERSRCPQWVESCHRERAGSPRRYFDESSAADHPVCYSS